MAQKVNITLIDDLDGTEIPEGKGATVLFGLDNKRYSIDLTDKNEKRLRDALAPFIENAQSVSGKVTASTVKRTRLKGDAKHVRDWARTNGFEVPDRGRIPKTIQDAYDAAH